MFPRFLSALACLLAALASLRAASIEYPGFGNLDLSEGTVEIWFTPLAGLGPESGASKWQALYRFLDLDSPGNFSGTLTLTQNNDSAKIRMRWQNSADQMLPMGNEKDVALPWKQGSPARLAFAWKGRWMGIYVDGVLQAERTQLAGMDGPSANLTIRLGSGKKSARPWSLQAIRVSAVARPAGEILNATPVADTATLLLDRAGDSAEGAKESNPLVIARIVGQPRAGVFKGETKLVTENSVAGIAVD